MHFQKFHGVIPALITPFNAQLEVDYDALRRIIDYLVESGVHALFITGTSAQALALTPEERRKIVEATIKHVAGRIPVIVHVGSTASDDPAIAADHARHAIAAGAAGIATLPPHHRGDFQADLDYYRVVGQAAAAAGPNIPLILYYRNDMEVNGLPLDPWAYALAVSQIPSFGGIKFVSNEFDKLSIIKTLLGNDYTYLTGADELLAAGLGMGFDGGVGTTFNLLAGLFVELYETHRSDQPAQAANAKVAALQARATYFILLLVKHGVVLAGTTRLMDELGLPAGPRRNGGQSAHTEKGFKSTVTDEDFAVLWTTLTDQKLIETTSLKPPRANP